MPKIHFNPPDVDVDIDHTSYKHTFETGLPDEEWQPPGDQPRRLQDGRWKIYLPGSDQTCCFILLSIGFVTKRSTDSTTTNYQ